MVAFALDGVRMQVRFFTEGYEVGRGRVVVPGRSSADEPEPTSGVLAVPDTVLS